MPTASRLARAAESPQCGPICIAGRRAERGRGSCCAAPLDQGRGPTSLLVVECEWPRTELCPINRQAEYRPACNQTRWHRSCVVVAGRQEPRARQLHDRACAAAGPCEDSRRPASGHGYFSRVPGGVDRCRGGRWVGLGLAPSAGRLTRSWRRVRGRRPPGAGPAAAAVADVNEDARKIVLCWRGRPGPARSAAEDAADTAWTCVIGADARRRSDGRRRWPPPAC
jgi:hypothetical protein